MRSTALLRTLSLQDVNFEWVLKQNKLYACCGNIHLQQGSQTQVARNDYVGRSQAYSKITLA